MIEERKTFRLTLPSSSARLEEIGEKHQHSLLWKLKEIRRNIFILKIALAVK